MTHHAPSSSPASEVVGLNLGAGPIPASGPEWEDRIRRGVLDLVKDDDATHLWEQVRVEVVAGAGNELRQVRLDLTGIHLEENHRSLRLENVDLTDVPPVTSAQALTVRRLEVLAQPVQVEGIPVTAHLVGEDIPGGVAYDRHQNLWALLDFDTAAADVRGHGTLSLPLEEALERGRSIVAQELAHSGLTLTSLDMEVQTPSPRQIQVQAAARVRKGLLSASAQIRVEAEVDAGMVARIGQVQARSGNPVVALVLVAVRNKLDRYTGTTIDLNAQMPPGLRLVDLSMSAGEDFTAQARFT